MSSAIFLIPNTGYFGKKAQSKFILHVRKTPSLQGGEEVKLHF